MSSLYGVEQRVPPVFGRAAITLGIGPHSSYFVLCNWLPAKAIPEMICYVLRGTLSNC